MDHGGPMIEAVMETTKSKQQNKIKQQKRKT